ncbi:MAG TPA: TMF family protein, partial [Puia sp.]|nr:TMF family protein [Puia sp.]
MKKMKSLFLLMILFAGKCFSQQNNIPIIHLDSLPPQGILLDKGWKFHEGDDTAWANADYDDSQWQTADLTQYKTYFSSFIKKNIGWFRRKIYIDSSSNNSQAAILLSQSGASDWFINGRIFIQFGKIISPGKIENYNPHNKPILFPGNLSDSVIIAIRFASNASVRPWLFEAENELPITVSISPWMNALSTYKAALIEPRMQIGHSFLNIGFGLLFILLYSFIPKERTYLLFGAFCFLAGMTPVIQSTLSEGSLDISTYGSISFLYDIVNKTIGMVVLSIISLEVIKKITIYQWCIIFYIMIIDSLIFFYSGSSQPLIIAGNIARGLFALELLRLGVIAFWKGNYIMGLVGLCSSFLNIISMVNYFRPISFIDIYYAMNGFLFFVLTAIYLAVKYARTSKHLAVQLSEVEKLSKQNLDKEQEKQQILSTQNEKLEQQVTERTAALNSSLKELKEAQS